MRRIEVRLTDETAEKLMATVARYGVIELDEALRFAAHFTVLALKKIEGELEAGLPTQEPGRTKA